MCGIVGMVNGHRVTRDSDTAPGHLDFGPTVMTRNGSPVIVLTDAGWHAAKILRNTSEVRTAGGDVIAPWRLAAQ